MTRAIFNYKSVTKPRNCSQHKAWESLNCFSFTFDLMMGHFAQIQTLPFPFPSIG